MPDVLTSKEVGVLTNTPIWQTATIEKPTISVWAFRLWCFRIGKINTFLLLFPILSNTINISKKNIIRMYLCCELVCEGNTSFYSLKLCVEGCVTSKDRIVMIVYKCFPS